MSRIGFQNFLKLQPLREAKTAEASEKMPEMDFFPNRLAALRHPSRQFVTVSRVEALTGNMNLYTLIPDADKGQTQLAPFEPGQYISVRFEIGEIRCSRPYSLCGSPSGNVYQIAIKAIPDGLCSVYARDHWTVGTRLEISAPEGTFVFQPLRDEKHILAIAGGSGITPFVSMAMDIAGRNDGRTMTVLYGCRTPRDRAFGDVLDALCSGSGGRLRTVYVFSEESRPGQRSGFIDESVIRESLQEHSSVFVSGPRKMIESVRGALQKIGLERKYIRMEVPGEAGRLETYPDAPGEVPEKVTLTVRMQGKVYTVRADPQATILRSLENAGIAVVSGCRSGVCGFCRSSLRSGNVFAPNQKEHEREADILYNQIHLCETYPLTDLELDVTGYPSGKEGKQNG